ncbi:MAG: oligosaccharide flippase family protein, partial [Acidobacteriota bacterium]|nr:oligosaccharide flippase family protein [Acidobacteriota bacterium]
MKFKLLRAGGIYGIGNVISAGVPFLLLPVLTRALSPADYGMVIGFFMLASLSSSLAGLSVHGAVSVKWFQRHTHDFPRLVGAALGVAIGSTLLCGILLLGFAPLLKAKLDLAPQFWFMAAIYTGANVILGIRTSLWQSQGLPMQSASLQVASAILNVGLSLLGVFALSLGGEGRIYGAVAASIASASAAAWFLFRAHDARWSIAKSEVSSLLRFGVPLIPHALAGSLMLTADRFAVASLLGREVLGIYGTAAQLGMAMSVVGDAMVKAASPWMYSQMSSRTTRASLRIVGATYLLIPISILVALGLWLVLK